MVIHPDCDIRLLVKAVVERAQFEAKRGNDEAREWLLIDGAEWLDMAFDIHPDHTRQWIDRNFKPRRQKAAGSMSLAIS